MEIKLGKKKPCAKCPYTLGQIRTPVNPCPECKANGYQMYKIFQGRKYTGNIGPAASEK